MKTRIARTAASAFVAAVAAAAMAGPFPGNAVLVSLASNGDQGNGYAFEGTVSNSGKVVAWYASSTNLGPVDGNLKDDVYVRDLRTGDVTLVSHDDAGNPGSDGSYYPTLSANGRWISYYSDADTLAPGSTGAQFIVYDRRTDENRAVSVTPEGAGANGAVDIYGTRPLSGNGRWAVFHSSASNLVTGDANAVDDVFLADLRSGTLDRISNGLAGEADGPSRLPSISPNGRWVVFLSKATNLVAGDANGKWDVFLYDVKHGTTVLASLADDESQGNGDCYQAGQCAPCVSNSGNLVGFMSKSTNLDPNSTDSNAKQDIFLRDRKAGTTKRVSLGFMGAQPDGDCGDVGIDAAGRTLTYWTYASNMIDATDAIPYDQIVYDVKTGASRRMLEALGGGAANGGVYGYNDGFSANGRWFVVTADADDVTADDTNGDWDVFLVDLKKKEPAAAGLSAK